MGSTLLLAVIVTDRIPRTDRFWAFLALLCMVSPLFLPFWLRTYANSLSPATFRDAYYLWGPASTEVVGWARGVTGAILALGVLLLFVRLAGASQHYEPKVWQRDLKRLIAVPIVAAASGLLWPAQYPSFWGSRTYESMLDGQTIENYDGALPGLGWWALFVAAICLVLAWRNAVRIEALEANPP